MKKKVLIGIALLLVVGLVAGCGKTTTVTTTATVTTMATTTKPVTTTATATTTVTAVQTTTATVKTTTTATVTSTVTVTAAAGGVTPPTLSFTAATYTDTTYKFTFKYDKSWTGTWTTALNPISFADATYSDPSVRIYVLPKATGATLADVLKSDVMITDMTGIGPAVIDKTLDDMTNVYGTKATPITYSFKWADGSTAQSKAFGFLQGDNWFIMFVTRSSGWNMSVDTVYPDEIFSTWEFTK